MTLGDQPAFPSEKCHNDPVPGMTYRQWLVGQIAAGASPRLWEMEYNYAVDVILNRADAIIAKMEGEGK